VTSIDPRLELADLYAAYADCLDAARFDEWPGFFTEECRYRLMPRENHEKGLPLCTMDLRSRGALKDRVYAVQSTLFHAPYYQRHIIGPVHIAQRDQDTIIAQANYLVLRTKRDLPSEVFNAGRYIDRVVQTPAGLRFAEKLCIFDSELVANSIIYPI
jgi:salicylate 5-hydroxylase small subunit